MTDKATSDVGAQARVVLQGWRLHPTAAKILLALMIAGLAGLVWLPERWEVARQFGFYITAFTAGMQYARLAAIWQKIEALPAA